MKAARLHAYHEALQLEELDEPVADGPLDVVVRIGGAGLCRTDLHIQEGQWAEKSGVQLPYTPGHENAGWVHEIGSGVTNVEVGDTVIVHPYISCGLCLPCRVGDDMHCLNGSFPGIDRDGGFADLLKTSARSVLITQGHGYFANSYRIDAVPWGWRASLTDHGGTFVAALERGAVLACQFHPELSGGWGVSVLRRWLDSARWQQVTAAGESETEASCPRPSPRDRARSRSRSPTRSCRSPCSHR